jgi:hypothetical protein
LLGLPPVHIGEESNALEGGHGVAWGRARRWRLAARLPGRNRAALEEVEHPILNRPFNVASRAIDFLARRQHIYPFDKIISHTFPFAEINKAFPFANEGQAIRVSLRM